MRNGAIAIIGAGMIGAAHAFGYRNNLPRFAKKIPGLSLAAICDNNPALAQQLADTYGFETIRAEWTDVMSDPEIGIVSIALPNFLHVDAVAAALDAGKHVICEKPLALHADDAIMLYKKAQNSKNCAATVFNYRRIPAVAEMRELIVSGDLGDLVHVVMQYQAEYAADPELPHSWRYERARAGHGALLDIGTHALDMLRFLCGEITDVVGANTAISIKERYLPTRETTGHSRDKLSGEKRSVENDDVVSALLNFSSGCQGTFVASRVAVGMGNTISVDVFGTRGTLRFNSQRPGQYEIARFTAPGHSLFVVMPNRPKSPYVSELLPVPFEGVSVGYAESFSFMIYDFLSAIASDTPMSNGTLLDGVRAAQIADAIQMSASGRTPISVPPFIVQ